MKKKADKVAELLNSEEYIDPKCIADLIQKEVVIQRLTDQQKIKYLETKEQYNKKQRMWPRWHRKEKEINHTFLPFQKINHAQKRDVRWTGNQSGFSGMSDTAMYKSTNTTTICKTDQKAMVDATPPENQAGRAGMLSSKVVPFFFTQL